ncbi:WAT1-related protein At5g07050-like [Brachypodium distachyon]|uniref:WAT1-related protein At5g07050-like n=1 Tax=Brachypodium distachyon TaxID=15368 RepID=UPI000D0CD9BC|nr:WAT1-related protein At5g07050-like [Brachypodium distachyon]|eukprot:XP_024318079.1 WAT1-related protein At5g07050-like [Brachypodium distachyon]
MPPFVLITYRSLIGAAVVAPMAVICEREMFKKTNLVALGWICISATMGVPLALGLLFYGLRHTTATYAANIINLLPIVTFIVGIVFRAEKLAFHSWPAKIKLMGAVVCVGGTMLLSLFKWKLLHLWPTHLLKSHDHANAAPASPHRHMIIGTLFLCGSCLSYAVGFSVQARLSRVFRSKYLATTMTCLAGSLQSVAIGLVMTPHKSAWKLEWGLQLFTVLFSGVLGSGVMYVLNLWAISRRGPTYPTMFNSLSLILTTAMDSVLLGTDIYLGSVLGTLLIILGLYTFLWGQAKERATPAPMPARCNQVQVNGEQAQPLAEK